MAESVESLKKELVKLKEENDMYKTHGGVGLYYELNRIVNETVAYTRKQTISSLLSDTEKGDKTFERTQALIKNAKEHILDMEEIKSKLKLSGNQNKDEDRLPFIETVAETRK